MTIISIMCASVFHPGVPEMSAGMARSCGHNHTALRFATRYSTDHVSTPKILPVITYPNQPPASSRTCNFQPYGTWPRWHNRPGVGRDRASCMISATSCYTEGCGDVIYDPTIASNSLFQGRCACAAHVHARRSNHFRMTCVHSCN